MSSLTDLVFWHACRRKDLPSILEHGLLPSVSRSASRAIYLSDDRFTAENYACFDPDEEWVVLEIPGHALDPEHLDIDDYEFPDFLEGMADDTLADLGLPVLEDWRDHNWGVSLKICHQVTYKDVISASCLRVHDLQFTTQMPSA